VAAAEPPLAARPALYGSGLKGKQVRTELVRQAAEEAEVISQAIVARRREGKGSGEIVEEAGFNPTRPQSPDWQRVLEKVAER
jgi:hypothetical protein